MSHFDILYERLKLYDEVQILELLDLTTVDILEQFKERIWERRDYIEREIELLTEDQDEEGPQDEYDGYEIKQNIYYDLEDEDEPQ